MAFENVDILEIENAEIWENTMNCSQRETQYGRPDKPNFSIIIRDVEMAERLREDGWNIKQRKQYSEDDPITYSLNIAIGYQENPKSPLEPEVHLVTFRGDKVKSNVILSKDTIGTLDGLEFYHVDLYIRPRFWYEGNTKKIKAYLKEGYFCIYENRFKTKYAVEESSSEIPWE